MYKFIVNKYGHRKNVSVEIEPIQMVGLGVLVTNMFYASNGKRKIFTIVLNL